MVFVRGNHDWTVDYEALFGRVRACERVEIGDFFDWWAQHYRGRLRFGPSVPAAAAARRAHRFQEERP